MWRLVSLTLYTGAQILRRSRRYFKQNLFCVHDASENQIFQRVTFLQFKKELLIQQFQ